jgi:hypothetical protein
MLTFDGKTHLRSSSMKAISYQLSAVSSPRKLIADS